MQTAQHRDMALGAAINKAAEELPEGFQISIYVEQGSGWAVLTNPDGSEDHLRETDLGLTESIAEFIRRAKGYVLDSPEE